MDIPTVSTVVRKGNKTSTNQSHAHSEINDGVLFILEIVVIFLDRLHTA